MRRQNLHIHEKSSGKNAENYRKLALVEKETHLTITVGFHVSFREWRYCTDISCIAIFKFRRTEIVLGAVGPQIQTVEEKTARVNETRVNMQRENSCSV